MVCGGGQREVARGQPSAGAQNELADVKIAAPCPHMIARRDRRVENNRRAFAPRALLHRHRVRAFRQRRASEDARRLSRSQSTHKGSTRRGFAHHRQPRRRPHGVRRPERVAVHRRVGERRLRTARDDFARQRAAEGLGEFDPFGLGRRSDGSEHALERLLDRHQRGRAHARVPIASRIALNLPSLAQRTRSRTSPIGAS